MNRSGVERYSIPLFFGSDYDVKLEVSMQALKSVTGICLLTCVSKPIPSCVSPERPPKYEVVTAGDYVRERLKATYGH